MTGFLSPRAVALQGVGFAPRLVALQGFWRSFVRAPVGGGFAARPVAGMRFGHAPTVRAAMLPTDRPSTGTGTRPGSASAARTRR